jgi:hypothetical protein
MGSFSSFFYRPKPSSAITRAEIYLEEGFIGVYFFFGAGSCNSSILKPQSKMENYFCGSLFADSNFLY